MKKIILRSFLFLFCLFLGGCDPSPGMESVTGFYFDTVITLSLQSGDSAVFTGALDLCAELDALLSKTNPKSDVYRINHAGGNVVTIDPRTADLLAQALYYSELTNGAFDISIEPLMTLWDFPNAGTPPDADAIDAARSRVDYRRISLDGLTVQLPADMQIDLGGIAKGYIADQVAAYCVEHGVKSGLLNFGGNVYAIGAQPDGQSWNIGIQNPHEPNGTILTALPLADGSLVTSGTYQRNFTHDGTVYHHILDPKTGYPVQNGLASVTILAPHSLDADALSTACFVLGAQEGLKLIESLDQTEAVFVFDDLSIVTSGGLSGISRSE